MAQEALAIGDRALPPYAHRFSPHVYTQAQLFACLVLKTFYKTDYRGITAQLQDHCDLRQALHLSTVPHFTTLQKASQRLLRYSLARRLFRTTVRRFFRRRRRVKRAAFDSTGLECGHRSVYYIRRRNGDAKSWQLVGYSRYAKLEAAIDCASHLLLAVLVGRGPRVDVARFVPLMEATLLDIRPETILADAGYDSEPNHRHAREQRHIRSFMPALTGRPTSKPPSGRYRRQMKQRLNKHYGGYGQRWQVETGISMLKRRVATAVNGRSYWSQCRELLLISITYNVMRLYQLQVFYRAAASPFLCSICLP